MEFEALYRRTTVHPLALLSIQAYRKSNCKLQAEIIHSKSKINENNWKTQRKIV